MRFNIEGSSQFVVMGSGKKGNSGRRVGFSSYFPKEHEI